MQRNTSFIAPLAVLALSARVVVADSISPDSYSATLDVGESVTIKKTVTVSESVASTTQVDVYFLADTTGSMGSYINTVRSAASTILSSVVALGADVQFAVGEYKDFPIGAFGGGGDFPYRLNTALTANQTDVQNGINLWSASGGADTPESQLAALEALSQSAGDDVGWRAGSEKILVWFGDAPGHDSATEPAYPGPTKADTIAALVARGVQVEAVNVFGVNQGIDTAGQATDIANATGGHVYHNINASAVDDVIIDAISTAFSTYSLVGIDTADVPAGVDVSVVPGSYAGSWDRSVERTFDFDVTFTGLAPGTYDFPLYATVDRGRVATELDRITVPGTPGVPDAGSTLALLGLAAAGLGLIRRR